MLRDVVTSPLRGNCAHLLRSVQCALATRLVLAFNAECLLHAPLSDAKHSYYNLQESSRQRSMCRCHCESSHELCPDFDMQIRLRASQANQIKHDKSDISSHEPCPNFGMQIKSSVSSQACQVKRVKPSEHFLPQRSKPTANKPCTEPQPLPMHPVSPYQPAPPAFAQRIQVTDQKPLQPPSHVHTLPVRLMFGGTCSCTRGSRLTDTGHCVTLPHFFFLRNAKTLSVLMHHTL